MSISMALGEGEHALMGEVYESAAVRVLPLVFIDETLQVDCFLSHVLGALLVSPQTQGVATLVHVHGAQAEAQDVEFARLAGALAIALAVDQLLVISTLGQNVETRLNAGAVVVDHAFGADRSTHVTLRHNEARWANWEPLLFAFLAVLALLFLAITSPERQRFFTSSLCVFKELWTFKIVFDFIMSVSMSHHINELIVGGGLRSAMLLSSLFSLSSALVSTTLFTLTSLSGLLSLALSTSALSITMSLFLVATGTGRRSMSIVHWLTGRGVWLWADSMRLLVR